jgi:ATP synthase protein I
MSDDFDARLRQARTGNRPISEGKDDGRSASASGLSMAFRIGVELVSALVVGVGIGYLLDTWLDTKPWFLVGFFFVGAAAGVLNVYRAASSIGLAPGEGPKDDSGTKT